VRITHTYDELKAEAEKRRKEYVASLPEPTPVNLEAVLSFAAPREFTWGGVGYRAPPLPFLGGLRCLVAANALRDLRESDAPAAWQAEAARVATRLLAQYFQPISPWRRRLTSWRRGLVRQSPADIERLLRWLLYIPDEGPDIPPSHEQEPKLDFLDVLVRFCRGCPAWVGADGLPISWAAYIHGSRGLIRAAAREDLRHSIAIRAAGTETRDFSVWQGEMRRTAGW
jgi:hypothetical protein